MNLQAPTIVAARALTDLIETAREKGHEAKRTGHERIAFGLFNIAVDLDGARTCLVQEGVDYLDAAWAFVDAGRRLVAEYVIKLNRAEAGRARA